MLLIVAGGFLGAGKTTALICLAQRLERMGKRCAVIMNDQGERLVDTAVGRATQLPVAEVTGGCFCCRFDDLVSATVDLAERSAVEVVLAEAVGSCADLTATVIRPLRASFGQQFQVAPLTVFAEPRRLRELRATEHAGALTRYLFEKQLQDAQLLVLTKLDTLQPRQRAELLAELARSLPGTGVLGISARTGEGMPELLDSVLAGVESHTPPGVLSIDYQTYANAEAELAWLNGEVSIRARSTDPARSVDWLRTFTTAAAQECVQRDLWVGHVKAYLDTGAGASKASVLRAGEAPSFDMEDVSPVVDARLLINARVRARPPDLDRLVRASLARADDVHRTSSSIRALRCFSPPPPRPTHRLVTP